MAYLEVRSASKAFGKKKVLEDLSLSVERGECVVVFGPSGCGKTTLLRLIAGVLEPDQGEVWIDGKSVAAVGPESRGVAMAFQNFALYPHMDAFENIASPLRARDVPEDEIKKRVHEIASLLRIDHVLDHLPRQLSNGQKQRTSLARSLVHGPSVLMLDDPLRNVDAKIRYEMRLELPRVFRRYRSTVLYVTQDYKEALALGDRIGVLVDGRFEQLDTPHGIYGKPRNRRVASLFGDPPINLFPIQVERGADGLAFARIAGQRLAMGARGAALRVPECVIGLRPEDVVLDFESAEGGIPVELEAVTPFNVRTVTLLKAENGTEILASRPEDNTLAASRGHRRGWARIDFERALFFDVGNGALL
ncbi:MAG TPA: ABC transporter ATP-binding protein [Anaeromyxobacteraceae bacterium]|nr:ABC transporter ATP-binding protein [Anaeromyxobacteraceae bacterium]